MESTNIALRVVLGVAETNQLRLMRDNCNELMKAYHFQQTIRQFSQSYLKFINEDCKLPDEPTQTLVNILGDANDMLFVEPTLGSESYIYTSEDDVPLGNVELLAQYFVEKPALFDAFTSKLNVFGVFPDGTLDEPDEGIVCVG